MKVLDSSFLIDYESGDPDAAAFLQANADEEFVILSTVYTEYFLGETNAAPEPDLPAVRAEIEWAEIRGVTKETADLGVDRRQQVSRPHVERSLGAVRESRWGCHEQDHSARDHWHSPSSASNADAEDRACPPGLIITIETVVLPWLKERLGTLWNKTG